jgi:hypothetical protein
MQSGGYVRTTNHQLTYYWEPLGDSRDFAYGSQVGAWVAKNEKVLNKKRELDVVKLLADQFPDLVLIETRDFSGRAARFQK